MIRGVVFDLDGTLLDSWSVHRHSLRRSATAVGLERPSAARLAAAQRATDVDTLMALVGGERLGPAHSAYSKALDEALSARPELAMPGAGETVGRLRHEGLVLGVCTGRSRQDAQRLLDASGLPIALTVAREDASRPKPAPDGLLRALRLLGLAADEAVFVGDSAADVAQGCAAGVRTLLLRGPSSAGAVPGPAVGEPRDLPQLSDLPDLVRGDSR